VADYGAPASLRLMAERSERQQALVLNVRSLEHHAREVTKQLEADRDVERQSLILGRAMLKLGCMLLTNGIMREDIL
jgi:hypothetical protein